MKKIALVLILFGSVIAMSSCDYDDSNDIDFITPNDSVQTNGVVTSKSL